MIKNVILWLLSCINKCKKNNIKAEKIKISFNTLIHKDDMCLEAFKNNNTLKHFLVNPKIIHKNFMSCINCKGENCKYELVNNNAISDSFYSTNILKIKECETMSDINDNSKLIDFICNIKFNFTINKIDNNLKNINNNTIKNINECKYVAKNQIIGLNNALINNQIFVSSRPSTYIIQKYCLLQQFKIKNIGAVFNLQNEGDHPVCGPNKLIEVSGYSYFSEVFAADNINVYNEGWKELDNTSSIFWMISIVKKIAITVSNDRKRVFIHCHSGLRKSCLVAICYYIYSTNLTPEDLLIFFNNYVFTDVDFNTNDMNFINAFCECKNIVYKNIIMYVI